MFDVDLTVVSICAGSIALGYFLSRLKLWWVALICSFVLPIALSYGWYWLSYLVTDGLKAPEQGGWDIVATIGWSIYAVPVCTLTLFLRYWWRRRSSRHAS